MSVRQVTRCLLEFIAVVAQFLEVDEGFTSQAISNLANAYSKFGITDEDALMRHLASAAMHLPAVAFSPQSVANIVNAFSKLSTKDSMREPITALLAHMSGAAQSLPPGTLDMQVTSSHIATPPYSPGFLPACV